MNTTVEYTQDAIKNRAKDKSYVKLLGLSFLIVLVLAGCKTKPAPSHTPAPVPAVVAAPAPAPVVAPPAPAPVAAPIENSLPRAASWTEYRRRAAQLIASTNASDTFEGKAPPMWNGIATVTVLLNGDGSVRKVDLMRGSQVSPEVNPMALAAAARVKNYGSVAHLPQPWQFNETFLYNVDNKFQLVTIVEGR